MLGNGRFSFGRSSNTNPFWATAGQSAAALEGVNPMGLFDGSLDGCPHHAAMLANSWVKTLDTGTITPTGTNPNTLVLATAGTGNTGPQMQWSYDGGTTAFAQFIRSTTKATWIRCRLKLSDATNTAFFFGLGIADTTILHTDSTFTGTAEAMGFYKTAGATSLTGVLRKSSTSTSQTLTGYAFADDTYKLLDMVWLGGTSVKFYVDNLLVYTQTTLTNEPTAAMALSVALDTTEAVAKTATIERICAFQEKAAA